MGTLLVSCKSGVVARELTGTATCQAASLRSIYNPHTYRWSLIEKVLVS